MKLHTTVIEKLVHIYETYGGHRNEQKLRAVLNDLDLSSYDRQTGERILVLTDQLENAKASKTVE